MVEPNIQPPMSVAAAARALGLHRATLDRAVATNAIPHSRLGRLVLIPAQVVRDIAEGRLHPAAGNDR